MKLSREALRRMILREMNEINRLDEGCPTGMPCPVAAAAELKDAGASPEEMLDWVAKLTQELLSPVERTSDDPAALPDVEDTDGLGGIMAQLPEEL